MEMQNKFLTALLHIKKFHLFFWLSVVFFGGLGSAAFAQTAAPDSSSLSARQKPDSLKKKSASGLEGPVKYTAHQITFSVDGRKSFLQGDVK
ncbi:MAG: hypothetical protein P8184_17815, partial [Calditrichia bacterium]